MVLYLDICCLKRHFDDQAQPRIRLESEAVLGPAIKVRVGELIAIAREVL